MMFDEWWNGDEANETAEGGDQKSLAKAAITAAMAAERERCEAVVRLAEPIDTYIRDGDGNERAVVDWSRTESVQ